MTVRASLASLAGAGVRTSPVRRSLVSQRHGPVQAATNSEIVIGSSAELEAALRSGHMTASGASVTERRALMVGAVYRCNALISGKVGTLPLKLIQLVDERTRREARDHPLWRVLTQRPNKWQKPAEFRRMLQTHVHFRGNGYAHIVRTGRRVTQLLPLDPNRMDVKQGTDLSLVYEYRRANGQIEPFDQEEIFHLRGLTLDGITGLSVLGYARESIGLALQTEAHGATLFKNGAQAGSVLEHPKTLSDTAYENIKTELEKFRGAENAHKTMLLEEDMKFKPIGMTSTDAQFLETRGFQRSDIAMFFGVPPHMLGMVEKQTSWGAGIEQQAIGFVTYTLDDWLVMWEEAIKADLIDEDDIKAKFNRKALVNGDLKTRWETYAKGLQWGVYSPDDVLRFEDENPRADGLGGQYYDPPNTAGRSSASDDPPKEGEDDDNPTDPGN